MQAISKYDIFSCSCYKPPESLMSRKNLLMYSLLENCCCNLTEKSTKRRNVSSSLSKSFTSVQSICGQKRHPSDRLHRAEAMCPNRGTDILYSTFSLSLWLSSFPGQLWSPPAQTVFQLVLSSLCFFPSGQKEKSLWAVTLFPRQGRGHGIHH